MNFHHRHGYCLILQNKSFMASLLVQTVPGNTSFYLVATDKGGGEVVQSFNVQVLQGLGIRYNHKFTIFLNYDYAMFMQHVEIRLHLLKEGNL